MARKVLMLQGY